MSNIPLKRFIEEWKAIKLFTTNCLYCGKCTKLNNNLICRQCEIEYKQNLAMICGEYHE